MSVFGGGNHDGVDSLEVIEQSAKIAEPLGFVVLLANAIECVAIHIADRTDSNATGGNHLLQIPRSSSANTNERKIQCVVWSTSFGEPGSARDACQHRRLLEYRSTMHGLR
jgi:hypothetical protein